MARNAAKDNDVLGVESVHGGFAWRRGAVSGLVATVVMGVAITAVDLGVLREAIAGLYSLEGSLLAGWIAHLIHGTIFGIVFAVLLTDPGLSGVGRWVWKTTLAGVVYGIVLAVAGAGIIMPIWLGVVGFPNPPAVPSVTAPMLLWHAVYGAVLGLGFAVLARTPAFTRS